MHKFNSYIKSLVASPANNQIEKEFCALKDDYQRIVYAEKFFEEHSLLTESLDPPKLSSKDNEKSEELRVLGNECYKQGKYKEALVYYNQRWVE